MKLAALGAGLALIAGCAGAGPGGDNPKSHFSETVIRTPSVENYDDAERSNSLSLLDDDECLDFLVDFDIDSRIVDLVEHERPFLLVPYHNANPEDDGHVFEVDVVKGGKVAEHITVIIDCILVD